jgi:hypothetical protein
MEIDLIFIWTWTQAFKFIDIDMILNKLKTLEIFLAQSTSFIIIYHANIHNKHHIDIYHNVTLVNSQKLFHLLHINYSHMHYWYMAESILLSKQVYVLRHKTTILKIKSTCIFFNFLTFFWAIDLPFNCRVLLIIV